MVAANVATSVDPAHHIVLKDGTFDGTTLEDLNGLFDGAFSKDKVVIHFHGGLVDKQSALDGARQLSSLIYDPAGAYPVYFIWESGWKEIVEQNLPKIFSEDVFEQIVLRVAQYALGKVAQYQDGATRGILPLSVQPDARIVRELSTPTIAGGSPFQYVDLSRVPEDATLTNEEAQQFETALNNDQVLRQEAGAIAASMSDAPLGEAARGLVGRASQKTLMSPAVIESMRTPGGGRGVLSTAALRITAGCVKALFQVIRRFAGGRDHGFHRTIVEEVLREFYLANVGVFLWDGMKSAIKDSFAGDPNGRGGAACIAKIDALWRAGRHPHITLVGHSAGAIYISEFLKAAASRLPADLKFSIILVNAACTFDLLAEALAVARDRIIGIRQFAMGDEREGQEPLVHQIPLLYPGDLLYMVSGILEPEADKPLVGMQRFYSDKRPYVGPPFKAIKDVQIAEFFGRTNSLIWSLSTVTGFACDLRTHGDFAADAATVNGMINIIRQGF